MGCQMIRCCSGDGFVLQGIDLTTVTCNFLEDVLFLIRGIMARMLFCCLVSVILAVSFLIKRPFSFPCCPSRYLLQKILESQDLPT
jgi:hypothetical protein